MALPQNLLGRTDLLDTEVCEYDIVFVGAVALAGVDPGLWAVDGGNKMVCSGLLYHSKAELVPARVTAISMKMRPSKTGTVHFEHYREYVYILCKSLQVWGQ